MSEIQANKISPASGTALQVGDSGDVITIPSGATITNNGTQTGFGGTNTALFKAYYNGNQSVSANTITKVSFNTEYFDSNNVLNTSNGTFTAPSDGTYYLHSTVYVGTAVSTLMLLVAKNNTIIERLNMSGAASGGIFGATILQLSASDYIDIYFRSNATNSYYGNTSTGELTRFEGYKLIT